MRAAAADKPYHEPEERDDPRNAVLDLADAAVRTALIHDLEAPLRARLSRLLPPQRPDPDLFAAPSGEPAATRGDGSPEGAVSSDAEIQLVALIRACATLAKLKMDAHAHGAVALIRTDAQARLDASKKARGAR